MVNVDLLPQCSHTIHWLHIFITSPSYFLHNYHTCISAVTGERFIARDLTFRNTDGPQNYQAVAFRSGSELSVFYRYQDTLYVHSQTQFYGECFIYDTVDIIFGNAAVVLQNCMIYVRRPMAQQKNTITAQGRTRPHQNTGISIHNSRVMAAPDLKSVQGLFKTFLGRPWREYSRTVYLMCFFDSLIDPAGWLEWNEDFALRTLYYGEYRNVGPGSWTERRVRWDGYRVITSVRNFIKGESWLPSTHVPFKSGIWLFSCKCESAMWARLRAFLNQNVNDTKGN